MSAFYGQVIGQAETPASRRGTAKSGIKVTAQSWDGSLITQMRYNDDDDLMVDLFVNDSSSAYGRLIFCGSLQELEEALKNFSKS